jgi:hypothetical protein
MGAPVADHSGPATARIDPRRDPAAVAQAITARWRPYRFRAYLFGLVTALVGTMVVVVATAFVELILAIDAITVPVPWSEAAWTIAFVVLFALAGAWAVARWLPRPFRAALESYVWLATRAEAHWAEVVGTDVPRRPEAMRAFLDATTVEPATAGEIATIWLALGDLDTARDVLASMPETTDLERHQKRTTTWLVDFVGGIDGPLDPLVADAATIADDAHRLEAQVELAIAAARVAIAQGRDWIAPMASVRALLGQAPSDVLWRFAFPGALRTMLLYGGIGVAAYWAFTLLGGAG